MEERQQAERLYAQYGPVVYRRCLRLLGEREAAKDATQEVFVKLLRDSQRLRDAETALPWIYRVATNHCLNQLRNGARRREESDDASYELASDEGTELFPDRQLARKVLARFDTDTQAIAVGVLVDGLQQDEVAATLGISRKTVSRRLERFLENARKFLARSET